MKRLHNLSIIHGELYFNNILLDEKSEPRITDFSTSRKTTDESVLGISCGVPLCMTPEFLNGDYVNNGTSSVAFSYEMLLYFMFTTDIIFHGEKIQSAQ